MKNLRAVLVAMLLACCAFVVHAQTKTAPSLAGEYHLEGVMETGSGLRLNDDGTFDWSFTYGALDLRARGKWKREGGAIDLVVDEMGYPPQLPETQFDRMRLRIDGADLVPAWPWDMDAFRKGFERGAYVRE